DGALQRSAATQPALGAVPTRQAAYAIAGMFLGIELMERLDPDRSEAAAVFDMMGSVAQILESLGPALAPLLSGLTE
ncbi:MAG: hypothetical protein LC722_07690, partial [Actinobacteria bacterium]|nr:hypothetical protein [Actinomycetota bacterium]